MHNEKKEYILKEALGYFLKYGVKNFTMVDIAEKLSVSKKTLYQLFTNKENLLFEVVDELWQKFLKDVNAINQEELLNPLEKIISIYRLSIATIRSIDPIFVRSLQKYQAKVMQSFQQYREHFRVNLIHQLLQQAKTEKLINAETDIDFFIQINFENVDQRLWLDSSLAPYSEEKILKYLIVYRLKGIATNPQLL